MFQSLEVDDDVSVFVHFTLHPRRSKLLASEKNGVIVVIFIICVLPLLFESPSTHILQTLRRAAQLNETRGLKAYMRRKLRSKLNFAIRLLGSGGGVNQFLTSLVCCSHKPMTSEDMEYSTWVIWMIFIMLCHH